ncbi:RNA-directed DNA polymerase, eukaryota, reverse transcriptase zinc-binding domain protein [Tanacetum coccineum]|uniref:RNA-directed DNA polymerase, eukaryota, reverse transcriptase zinc-binding domain protein n=1 Tax=Tanacetum coccineum TaxID=301880 RepID=A0ABQ5F1J1_9ASTR
MEKIDLWCIKRCWGNLIFDYVYSESVGNSGGILCIWDPNMFKKINATVSDYFTIVRGVWVPSGKRLLIISVYAPQELSEKKMLWDYLLDVIVKWDGEVVSMGDFNEVRDNSERYGSVFNKHGADAFNAFIANAGLVEVPLGGCSFTWCHKSATKMSKLDRFLVSDNLMCSCPSISSTSLDRFLSDHRPIIMREIHYDYGPTPFKFFHYWFEIDGFDKLVEESWKEANVTEHNSYSKFMQKIKYLKEKIRTWHKLYKENSNNRKSVLKAELNDLDVVIDNGNGTTTDVNRRQEVVQLLQEVEKNIDMEMAQKVKIKWAIEGDENSKYYHGVLNKKRGRLTIRGVLVEGIWMEAPHLVKNEFFEHFKNSFAQPNQGRVLLDRDFVNRITMEQNDELEREVSIDEIKRAVWECGVDKAPGPDGFTFGFYRRYWDLIQTDVIDAVKWFFVHGRIPKGGNSSFITLIPKVPNASMVKEFRPISLIGSLYKIIAKVLANRMVMVLNDLVNEIQSAFVADRQILDGPFMLNEIVQWCKSKKKQSMIFKVDFEKAYDSVRWDFIDDILRRFGFGEKWCMWIQSCLHSSRGSVLVNGSPTKEFQFYKGLKQGDPLSPFLFILVMESLHVSFQRVVEAGLFSGIKLAPSLQISHLFYADDAIFMGQWSQCNIDTITRVLEVFHRASGLRINMNKSKLLGISVDSSKVSQAAEKIGCMVLKTPFNYLGSRVGDIMSRIQSWSDVIEGMRSRLSRWKLKTLSIGGRLTLLKSVLGAIPIYQMSLYKVPMKVLQNMETIRSRFFNGADCTSKKPSWVRWNNVLASKDSGGLGVSSLFALNRALMFKWVWRFVSQKNSLWARVIKALYGEDGKIGKKFHSSYPSIWLTIINEFEALKLQGIDLFSFLTPKLGNGVTTSFWDVAWRGDIAFKRLVPRLYALETRKNIAVAVKLSHGSLEDSFRRKPRGGVEQAQLELLKDKVGGLFSAICTIDGVGL